MHGAHPVRPRLIASDLDGTLLRSDGSVSPRTVTAVTACERAGMTMVLATGRPPRWIESIGDQLGQRGIAVCANGALVYDLDARRVVSSHPLSPEAMGEIVQRLRFAFPGVLFAVETVDHLGLEPGWKTAWTPPEGTRFADALELVQVPAVKLLARIDGHDVQAALSTKGRELAHLAEVTWSGGQHLLELSAPGVNKGATLAELAAQLHIPAAEVVAFGDMPNDLEMLRWAGRGLAVANAHEAIRAAADAIVGSNDDDGVAIELESLVA